MTFGQIKVRIAGVLGMAPSDPRVIQYVNEATELLLNSGKWKGTIARYRVCVNQGCLTWPRELETIEAYAIDGQPGTVRNDWFEFLDDGPGVQGSTSCLGNQLLDRGESPAFDDVLGTGKKIAVYCDGAEDTGNTILLQYYDSNANKKYSDFSGAVIEGERIALPASPAYAYTSAQVMAGGLYRVIKPITKRPVRLYEYTVAGGALKALAYYEPDEEIPMFRRSLVPGLTGNGGTCDRVTMTVQGKLRFRPITGDDSFLMVPHMSAIRSMVQSVKKEEDNVWDEAVRYEASAMRKLDNQLAHHKGSGAVVPMRIVGSEVFGGGTVENLI